MICIIYVLYSVHIILQGMEEVDLWEKTIAARLLLPSTSIIYLCVEHSAYRIFTPHTCTVTTLRMYCSVNRASTVMVRITTLRFACKF